MQNIIITALLLAGGQLCRAQEIPDPFPAAEIFQQTLPNGLRLVLREDHSLPLVAMVVTVHAGSASEQQAHGIAHYLEHLTFQGTRHYPGALAPESALEQVGAILMPSPRVI